MKNNQKYLQCSEQLRQQIANGTYPEGSRFPSIRELTKTFNISYITANNAIKVLEAEGLLRRCQGRGTFVTKPRLENTDNTIHKAGYFLYVNVSFFNRFFDEILKNTYNKMIYNIPLPMLPGTTMVTPQMHEKWLSDVFKIKYDSITIFADRHFPFRMFSKYENQIEQINFVFYDNSALPFSRANRIVIDMEYAGYLAASHLLKQKCKNIAMLSIQKLDLLYRRQTGITLNDHENMLLNGMERAFTEKKKNFYEHFTLIEYAKNSEYEIAELIKEKSIDGFFLLGDHKVTNLYKAAEIAQKTVGRDLLVVGMGNTPISQNCNPLLTTINMAEREIGKTTADIIMKNLHGQTVKIKPELIIRESSNTPLDKI